jgi:phage gpG-like protein
MTITTNAAEVIGVMNGVLGRIRDARPVMERLAEHAASGVMSGIMSEKASPDDIGWAPWSMSRRGEREDKGNVGLGLLWDTGDLLASIKVKPTRNGFEVGTALDYGKWLHDGVKKKDGSGWHMPPRPWMGWGRQDIEVAERWLVQYIAGALL